MVDSVLDQGRVNSHTFGQWKSPGRQSSRLDNYLIAVDVENDRRAFVLGFAPLVTSFRGSGQYFLSLFGIGLLSLIFMRRKQITVRDI